MTIGAEREAPAVDEVVAATAKARAGGDPARWPDKLPVRDRLAVLFDPGTFVEDGLLVAAADQALAADGVITGVGRVDRRPMATRAARSWGRVPS